jgi:hypothetical protein
MTFVTISVCSLEYVFTMHKNVFRWEIIYSLAAKYSLVPTSLPVKVSTLSSPPLLTFSPISSLFKDHCPGHWTTSLLILIMRINLPVSINGYILMKIEKIYCITITHGRTKRCDKIYNPFINCILDRYIKFFTF